MEAKNNARKKKEEEEEEMPREVTVQATAELQGRSTTPQPPRDRRRRLRLASRSSARSLVHRGDACAEEREEKGEMRRTQRQEMLYRK